MCPQIESLGHEKLNKPLSCAKMEQLWELSVMRLSRYKVYLQHLLKCTILLVRQLA